jgi:hypothetical protein
MHQGAEDSGPTSIHQEPGGYIVDRPVRFSKPDFVTEDGDSWNRKASNDYPKRLESQERKSSPATSHSASAP